MSDEYADILIRIGAWDEAAGTYPVEATLDDGGRFLGGELRLDQEKLLAAELDATEYGLELFYALFCGPIRRAYDKITGRAEAETEGRLRVRLWIDDGAAELHALLWERLYHIHKGKPAPLAISTLTPFSRYTGLEIAEPRPVSERPVRLFFAIANPRNLPPGLSPIDVEQEVENLHQVLGNLRQKNQVQVTLLPGRSGLSPELRTHLEREGYQIQDGVTSLEAILRSLAGCHVFHFLGHGHLKRPRERGEGTVALFLEKEDGTWQAVKDDVLETELRAINPPPHLVFLAACESARREAKAEHPFVGLGPRLVRAGVPAVVAMQDVVPMALARRLTADFYQRLLEHGLIDLALNQARHLLFEQEKADWAIPVLFMRLERGQLFAADPVRTVLQAIHHDYQPAHLWGEGEYLPIPTEVVHLAGDQDPGDLEWLEQESMPSLDLVEAAIDLFSRKHQAAISEREGRGQLVLLVGGHGTAKSTQMYRIAWTTAARSLHPDADRQVIPLYVDLRAHSIKRSGPRNPLEALMLKSLKDFWPQLTATGLRSLLRRNDGPVLRVLLDGSDDLPDRQRRDAWRAVGRLVLDYPRHEYMLAIDPAFFDPRRLGETTDMLVVQPLSQRKIEQFLQRGPAHPADPRLYRALSQAQLFDLAAIPWLLARMLKQARREGIYPRSRKEVLQSLVEDAIAELPTERGMRSRAEQTLYALAWEMQTARSSTWAVRDAFRTMAAVRGHREYSLEDLYEAMVGCGLLAQVGQDAMRFAYPVIQAYCCARAILQIDDRDQTLDDITASLGRLTRLRWWEDTLVLLSGLTDDPSLLIGMIVYGVNLTEGEQVFLAVRCLLESDLERIDPDPLIDQVIDALVWRMDRANEPHTSRRIRAAHALGQLRHRSAIPYLARVANQRIRIKWSGKPDYDYSNVRMAAAVGLQHLMSQSANKDVEKEIATADPELAELLRLWVDEDVETLADRLRSKGVAAQAIAAFALGDLQTPQAVDLLITVFLDPGTMSHTRWAAANALALLDPVEITNRAILPFLDADAAAREGLEPRAWKRRADWYGRLAYLIGKVRAQDPTTRDFLDCCLYEFKGVGLKGKAIQSLGWLYDRSYKDLFEEIAVGDFRQVALRKRPSKQDKTYLRRKAIEALANIGDEDTLNRLRENRADWKNPELARAFYWTSEEISWRLSLGAAIPVL